MMIKRIGKYLFFITGLMACFFSTCYAQEPVVKTSLDNNKILIGQQFKLKIEVDFSADDYTLHWATVPDSMQHFEIIGRSDIDSLYENNQLTSVTQTFTVTSFDSGQWQLPSFMINLKAKKNDSTVSLFSDSLPVTVSYSPLDSTNHFKEIKPIIEVHTSRPFWQWIAGGVLILLLIIAAIWLYRRFNKKKPLVRSTARSSAYQTAIKDIDALKRAPVLKPAEIKLFHTRLSEIFREYLSAKENIDYKNKTTGDILVTLNNNIDKVSLSKAAAALRCSDAVKFAKYLPPTDESMDCLLSVQKIIELLNKNNL